MGRGRQKAKQTKVARELKYFSPDTDYNALQRELHGPDRYSTGRPDPAAADSADTADEDTDEDTGYEYPEEDDGGWPARRRA